MKNKKLFTTGFLALTLTTAGYLLTGCEEQPGNEEVNETVYNIKYEVFGGNNHEQNPDSYRRVDSTFALKDASKPGYEFEGWYKEASFDTLVTTIENGSRGHLKLYAKFKPIEYAITYDLGYGELDNANPVKYTVESQNISINNPTRAGYTFLGWKSNYDDKTIVFRRILTGSTGDKSYTAVWVQTDHSITINSARGTVEIVSDLETATYGQEIAFDINPDAGYEIDYIKINGETVSSTTRVITMPDEDLIIDVAYKIIVYEIKYENMKGATNHPDNPEKYSVESGAISIKNPSKPGYGFVGWKTSEEGQVLSNAKIEKGSIGDRVYIAVWKENNYSITKSSAHGEIEIVNSAKYGERVTFEVNADPGYEIRNIKINGKSLEGDREFTMPDAHIIIEVEYDCIEYSVEYNLNGGINDKNPESYTVETGLNLNNPYKEGYAFVGWYEDAAFEKPYSYNKNNVKNLVLYARFAQAAIDKKYYDSYQDAIEAAVSGDVVELLVDMKLDETLMIDKDLVIVGEDVTISPSESFNGRQLIEITSGNVYFEGLIINADNRARNIKISNGHLGIYNTIVTNGYLDDSYISGVYVTGKATFEMHGGKIVNNTIKTRNDYIDYATDLWIGSQASGEVGTITGGAEIGSVFVNSNSSQGYGMGVFTLADGTIDNVYVEYDSDADKYATFNYEGGVVNHLRISKNVTGTYVTIDNPNTGTYKGGHLVTINDRNSYRNIMDAINTANEKDIINVLETQVVVEPIAIDKTLTIVGLNDSLIKADDDFSGNAMIIINNGNVILRNLTLDGNHKGRVIRANDGHLELVDTIVTNGHLENSYVSGVYITGKATFAMNGGKIVNNTIKTRNDYIDYATDIWIGSQASGEVGTITGGAEIGSVFVNSNSSQGYGMGIFTLTDGTIDNVYVEYDSDADKYATFNYEGGVVNHLHISKNVTGTYTTMENPNTGTYKGGHLVEAEGKYYKTLAEALRNLNDSKEIIIYDNLTISEPVIIERDVIIIGLNNTIIASDDFSGNAMIIINKGSVILRNLTLDGNHKGRVIRANDGHLELVDTIVTNGHLENSYVSGVYITGKATFAMNGGKIVNNTIKTRYDYIDYATDLWIGSQASGEVGTITGGAEIGSVFVNSNSSQGYGMGIFTLNDGTIDNVYVEYDSDADKYATFNYEGGVVQTLRVSQKVTSTYWTVNRPIFATYIGGVDPRGM